MIRRTLVGLIVIAGCVSAADPAPRVDREGVPLPTEAVQRLGSAKFLVNNLKAAAFSPDGKRVYTISDADQFDDRVAYTSPGLIAWEVPTGKKLWQVGVDHRFEQVVADPDGKSVWVIERFKLDHEWSALHAERVRFSPSDGRELARTPRIEDWNTAALHPTGLMVYHPVDDDLTEPTIRVIDRDGKSSDIRPFQTAKPGSIRAIVWSPKADRLFIVTWMNEFKDACLTALDVTTAKQIWSKEIDSPGGWCVPPNGKSFVIVTQAQQKDNAPTIARRLDAETGKENAAVDIPGLESVGGLGHEIVMEGRIHFHPGGKRVFLLDKEDRTVEIDAATWKKVATKINLPRHTVFHASGRIFAAPSGRHIEICETETRKRLSPDQPKFSRTSDEVLVPYIPDENVTRLRFSPNSHQVIRSGGYDGV